MDQVAELGAAGVNIEKSPVAEAYRDAKDYFHNCIDFWKEKMGRQPSMRIRAVVGLSADGGVVIPDDPRLNFDPTEIQKTKYLTDLTAATHPTLVSNFRKRIDDPQFSKIKSELEKVTSAWFAVYIDIFPDGKITYMKKNIDINTQEEKDRVEQTLKNFQEFSEQVNLSEDQEREIVRQDQALGHIGGQAKLLLEKYGDRAAHLYRKIAMAFYVDRTVAENSTAHQQLGGYETLAIQARKDLRAESQKK